MPDPAGLLAAARLLLSAAPAEDAQLRRAVSTAYYALFHKVAQAAAERFMGTGMQEMAGYGLIYRSFNHGRMKAVCVSLDVKALSRPVAQQLGRSGVSGSMRAFASAFVNLQEQRHLADYDPTAMFAPADAQFLVDAAKAAITAFDQAPPDERADVLALMLANPRG